MSFKSGVVMGATVLLTGCGFFSGASNSGSITRSPASTLDLGQTDFTALSGESYTLSVPGGTSSYQWNDTNSWINLSTGTISIPISASAQIEKISVRDASANSGSVNLHVRSFLARESYAYVASTPTAAHPYSCVADSLGNIFVAGTTYGVNYETASAIRKYSGGAWTEVGDFSAGSFSSTTIGIAVAPNNDLYAAGSLLDINSKNWITRKSIDHGATWTIVDNIPSNGATTATSIAFATIGGVQKIFVGGAVGQFWTIRMSSDAGATWTTVDSVASVSSSSVNSMASDSTGAVYAAGYTVDSTNGFLATVHKTTDGTNWTTVYTFQYSTPSFTGVYGNAVISDGAGNVYLGGWGFDSSFHIRGFVHRSSDYGLNWASIEDTSDDPSANQSYNGFAFDAANNLLAVAALTDSGGTLQWLIRKKLAGSTTFSTLANVTSVTAGSALCKVGANSFYTVGSDPVTLATWKTYRSIDSGSTWNLGEIYVPTSPSLTRAQDLVTDTSGKNFAVGYAAASYLGATKWISRMSSDQGTSWTAQDDYSLLSTANSQANGVLSIDSGPYSGRILAVGFGTDSTRATHWIVRTTLDQGASWNTTYDDSRHTDEVAYAVAFDKTRNAIFTVGRYTNSSSYQWLVQKSVDGGASWSDADDFIYEGSSSSSVPNAISIDSSGNIFVTGAGRDTSSGHLHLLTRMSANGGSSWTTIDDYNVGIMETTGTSLALDSQGSIYVSGLAGASTFMRKSSNNGVSWSSISSFPSSTSPSYPYGAAKLSLADDGSLYVAQTQSGYMTTYRSRDQGATFAAVDSSNLNQLGYSGAIAQCASNRICAIYNAAGWTTRQLSP